MLQPKRAPSTPNLSASHPLTPLRVRKLDTTATGTAPHCRDNADVAAAAFDSGQVPKGPVLPEFRRINGRPVQPRQPSRPSSSRRPRHLSPRGVANFRVSGCEDGFSGGRSGEWRMSRRRGIGRSRDDGHPGRSVDLVIPHAGALSAAFRALMRPGSPYPLHDQRGDRDKANSSPDRDRDQQEDRDADRNRVNGHPTESRNDQDHNRDDEVKGQSDSDEIPGSQFLIGAG
jgi:hypothetical protein